MGSALQNGHNTHFVHVKKDGEIAPSEMRPSASETAYEKRIFNELVVGAENQASYLIA
jgi:hypothetical protein